MGCELHVRSKPVRKPAALPLALVAALSCAPPPEARELELEGEALGTTWSVQLVHRGELREDAVRPRIARVLDRVDRGMSTWRDDAEIVRFNRAPDAAPFRFTPETAHVVAAALRLARETDGAFDPTVAPLVRLWGFGAGAASTEPRPEDLTRDRARVGWRHLSWDDEGRVEKRRDGVELDLSAIAKGYAVDAILREFSPDRPLGLLVEIGGDVRAFGTRGDGRPWRLGIDDPAAPGSRLAAVVALTEGALATSGDYRQTRVVGGRRRSHIVDPRSGLPVENGVASASVLAPTCMEADGVATALMVLGPERGLAWVEARPWLAALILVRDGDRIVGRHASSTWSRWVAPDP